MANRYLKQFTFTPHNKSVRPDCSFVVDHANGNGFGVRSLKPSGLIATVFMNSTAPNSTNPNPVAGVIIVNMQDNYARYLGGFAGMGAPLSGSAISSGLSIGSPYVIVSLGASTVAQWVAAGVPSSITPAVGVSFIASATSVAGGGTVMAPATAGSGIDHIEVIGDPNAMDSNSASNGMQIILACFKNGVLTAPADNTVISMFFEMNDSSSGV
jgi:hypothetical protein